MAVSVGSVSVEVVPDTSRFSERMRVAMRNLPPIDVEVRADTSAAEAALAALARSRLTEVEVRLNDATARARLDALGRSTRVSVDVALDGRFAATVRAKITAALKDLPKVDVGVATTEAEQKIKDLKLELASIRDTRIGVDVDQGAALARIAEISAEIRALGAESPSIGVRVDTAAASAHLEEVKLEVDRLDGRDAKVDVSLRGVAEALPQLGLMTTSIIALGPAIVPVLAVASAGIVAIGAAAVVAAAGVGVLALAFHGIASAVQAEAAVRKNADKDAAASAAAQAAAEKAVEGAVAGVASARRAADTAARSAAAAVDTALTQQVTAERTLQAAQKSSLDAQKALTQARKDAAQQLQDLASANANAALSERQGQFDLQDATANLRNVSADPGATAEDKAKAQLQYDQAVQNLKDLTLARQRAADAKATADAKGVDGSDQVKTAQDQVAAATTALADAQVAAGKATQAVAQAQIDGARQVADAQTKVTEALRAQVEAQTAATAAASKQSASQEALTAALAGLSPAGRAFVAFIDGKLRPALSTLAKAAQQGLLPGVQAGLTSLLPFLPTLTGFVTRLATAMGELFRRALQALGSPFWQQFFGYIGRIAGPVMTGLFTILGNLGRAFASLLQAFSPFSDSFGGGLVSLTARFAAFTAGLSSNPGFQRFLAYVRTEGPVVAATIGSLVLAIVHIGVALAPIGAISLAVLGGISNLLRAIPTPILTVVAAGIIAITVAGYALGVVIAILDSALVGLAAELFAALLPILPEILLVVAAIAVIGVVIYEVVKHFDEIKQAGAAVVQFFADHWKDILLILTGPFGLAVTYIQSHWSSITQGASNAASFIGRVFTGIWDGIVSGFKAAINLVIRGLNSLHITIPSVHVPLGPTIGGQNIGIPQIPYLAAGGIVTGPTVAMIGEAGPEAVLPLSQLAVPGFASSLGAAAGADAPPVHVTVRNYFGDQEMTNLIRTVVTHADRDNARQLSYGRRL